MATPVVNTVEFIKDIIIEKIIDDKLFSIRTQTQKQKIIKENLKKFYKDIENIKAPLNEIVKEYQTIKTISTENAIDLKAVVGKKRFFRSNKGLEKYKVKLKDAVKTFKSNWLDDKDNYLTKNSNITNDPKQYEESQLYYYTLQSNILGIEESILNYFKTEYKNIIDPDETISTQYDAAINAAKAIHTYKSKKILKIEVEDNFNDSKEKILDFCINVRPYLYSYSEIDDVKSTPPPSTSPTASTTQLVDQLENKKIGSSYIKAIYKTKMDVVLKAIENINAESKTQKEAAKDLTKNYRKLLKYLFMIMENYYFQDLKYKHKWSYKTLNNSYKKNKVGTWKRFKRDFTKFGQTITTFGKYKSKVRLGRKYRINPLFGVEKSTSTGTGKKLFSYNIKDLTKHKEDLVKQIKVYDDYIKKELGVLDTTTKTYVPRPNKHYEFYEVKKRLEKEIRKLKIIKFFLLRKTVRLKSRTFGKRPKLLNTIDTLKAKIKQRDKKFKNKNFTTITKSVQAKNLMKDTKKSKTKKRLKKLSKMLRAQDVITAINATVNYYKSQNNTNSDRIKNAIETNKTTAAKEKVKEKERAEEIKARAAAQPTTSSKASAAPTLPIAARAAPPGPPPGPPLEYKKILDAANAAKGAAEQRVTVFERTLVNIADPIPAEAAAILDKVTALSNILPSKTAALKAAQDADRLAKEAKKLAEGAKRLAGAAVAVYATYVKSLTDLKDKALAESQTTKERLAAETAVAAAETAATTASEQIGAAQNAVRDAKTALAAAEKLAADKAAADKAAADQAEKDRLAKEAAEKDLLEAAELALNAATEAAKSAELALNAANSAKLASDAAKKAAAAVTSTAAAATLTEPEAAATEEAEEATRLEAEATRLETAAQEQVTAAQEQVTAAQEQVTAAEEQVTAALQVTAPSESATKVKEAEGKIAEAKAKVEEILNKLQGLEVVVVGGSRKTKKSNLRKTKKSKSRKIKDKTTKKTKKTNKSKKTKKQ